MKLSIDTYVICADWPLDRIIQVCRAAGYAGVEFRSEDDQAHGVELEASPAQRVEIKRKMEDAYLDISCISTSQCMHQLDAKARRQHVDRAKRFVDLAADLDARAIRLFGDGDRIPPDQDSRDAIKRTAEALEEVVIHAEDTPVYVLLEMHGQFNHWKYARGVMELIDIPGTGLNYNCDPRDVIAGSVQETYFQVREWIEHVHMHDLEALGPGAYPYVELFGLLMRSGYAAYCSLEVDYQGGDPDKVIALYASLWRTQVKLAARTWPEL